jgi:hypothetical protein
MTTLTLHNNAAWWERAWHVAIVVPTFAIRKWLALFLITTGTLYASAMFNMQHGVFPPEIAYPLAIGIEWTYLSGLAYATELRSGRWSGWMIVAGALTSGLYGVLYILGHYGVIPAQPAPTVALILALAHVLPLIALLLLYTLCKRDFTAEQRAYSDRQREREEQWRDEKLAIEIERERLTLERERLTLTTQQAKVKTHACPSCEAPLTQQQAAVAKRWGHCRTCKPTE